MTAELTAGKSLTDDSMAEAGSAVLIVGHGTRDPVGLAEFRFFVEQVARQRPAWHVTGCFLELAEPSIATAVDRLVAGGLSRIRAMPLVLFSAGHAKRDIPDALARAIARNPGLEIELCPRLGCHPAILELSVERCRTALVGQTAKSPDETLLILVGRGSSDVDATAQMRQLADWRRVGVPSDGVYPGASAGLEETRGFRTTSEDTNVRLAHVEIGFVAVATPSLGKVLEDAARTGFQRVIVQPHLLFAGSVLAEIRRLVEQRRLAEEVGTNSRRQWIVTEALGPDRRLVTAVVDIVSAITPRPHGNKSEPNPGGLRYTGRA